MRILPEPAHFKKPDYRKFLRSHPHAEDILAEPYRDEDGESVSLVKESGTEVLVYVGLLSENQRKKLGDAALRTLNHHLPKEGVNWKVLLSGLIFLAAIGVAASVLLRMDVFRIIGEKIESILEKTPTPAVSPTPGPEASPTPTQQPTNASTATPNPRPTATPTQLPSPTPPPPPRPTPTKTNSNPPRIKTIALLAENGNYVHPDAKKTYYVRSGERLTFRIELQGSGAGHKIEIHPIRGKADGLSYVFPSAAKDLVTVKIIHISTGKIVAQDVVTIKRFGSEH